jgi:acyl-[acyl-carrier-protein] desaturase
MACYGALQEGVTYLAYRLQKEKARDAGDKVLEAIFHLVARDEAAHGGFYRAEIVLELLQDRRATVADLAYVLSNFKMPGDGLIPNYQQRLRASGAGVSPRAFIERVVSPLLITLQITRQELKEALRTGTLADAQPDLIAQSSIG